MPKVPENTKCLLHFNGENDSTIIVDSINPSRSIECYGNTKLTTTQSKMGGVSLETDGQGPTGILLPYSTDWVLSSNDFTIAMWIRFRTLWYWGFVWRMHHDVDGYFYFAYEGSGDAQLRFRDYYGGLDMAYRPWYPSANVWYHIAATRANGYINLFINGTRVLRTYVGNYTFRPYIGDPLNVAGGATDGYLFNGWMDEFIWVNGTAIWEDSFTPPEEPWSILRSSSPLPMPLIAS
jgi:hypothetical protein